MLGKDSIELHTIKKLYQSETDKAILSEKTEINTTDNEAFLYKPDNADDLWQKRGDYLTYEEMLKDEQVKICLNLKKDLMLNSGWEILTDVDENKDMAIEIETMLKEDPLIPFDESLEEILTAFDFGFSISEKIFMKKDDRITLKYIKTRHPQTWKVHTDKYGNIKKYEQKTDTGDIEINKNSLIHFVHNRRFSNPYGESDLRAAHTPWVTKRNIIRMYAIFLESCAKPIPIARFDKAAPHSVKTKIYNILKSFQTKTAIVFPKDIEVEFLQTTNTGDAYDKAVNIFNMMIGRALLATDLLGIAGSETSGGSYALGDKHFDLFMLHIDKRKSTLERLINQEIIRPLVTWNYGLIEDFPKFKFKDVNRDDRVEAAKLWVDAVKGRVYKPTLEEINNFRSVVDFPQSDDDYELPEPIAPQQGLEGDTGEGSNPPIQNPEIKEDVGEKKAFQKKVFDFPEGDYHKKVNFQLIENQLNGTVGSIKNETDLIIDEIFEDIVDQVVKKKIIQNRKIDKIDTIKIKKLKSLNQILNKNFRELAQKGKKEANSEIFKSNFAQNLTTDEIIELIDKETFNFIGDWEYKVDQNLRVELAKSLKEGTPLSTVISNITTNQKNDSKVAIDRYARTKTTEVFNEARREAFNESGVVSGYQYSAILDDRTTDICSSLHGAKFISGSEPIPPLHFNCRSVLIPITKFEEFTPDKTSTSKDDKGQTTVKVTKKVDGKSKTESGTVGKGFSF